MSHKSKKCLKEQARARFQELQSFGKSKHDDKYEAGREYDQLISPAMTKQEYINAAIRDKIYSYNTYGTYAKHNNYFLDFCEKKYKCKTLEQCRAHVDEWLQRRIDQGLSAYTIATEKAGLCKLFGEPASHFIETPTRKRENITRSRGVAIRDTLDLEKHAELINFCRGTGLRRSELENLTGSQLRFYGSDAVLVIKGKGGRYREAPIIGPHKDEIVAKLLKAGKGKVWESVPSHMDVHSYRSEYATAIYTAFARPIEEIPYDKVNNGSERRFQSSVYICRGNQKGRKLDKEAMRKASKALGHNRLDVVAGHYIR